MLSSQHGSKRHKGGAGNAQFVFRIPVEHFLSDEPLDLLVDLCDELQIRPSPSRSEPGKGEAHIDRVDLLVVACATGESPRLSIANHLASLIINTLPQP